MTKNRLSVAVVAMILSAARPQAADVPFVASHLVTGPASHVELTNNAAQPVTAWTIVITTNEADGRVHRASETVDAYLSEVTREFASSGEKVDRVMPGQTREIALDPVPPGSVVEVEAVIFDDRTSAGDRAAVAAIFEQRVRERDELRQVVEVFEAVLPSKKGAEALQDLKRRFAAAPTPESTTYRAAREAVDAYLQRETPAAADAIDQLIRRYADIVKREYDLAEKHSHPKN